MLLLAAGCAGRGKAGDAIDTGWSEDGLASYYAGEHHGRRTASGEVFDQEALTAAHRTLPFGTMIRVTRLDTGKSVTVRINDRGPRKKERVVDVSLRAARVLGFVREGLVRVRLTVKSSP